MLIPLTQGQEAVVDGEDYERINQFKWCASWAPCTGSFYAQRNLPRGGGKRITQAMHRLIMGLEPGDPREVDHRNHDTLDNQRSNLRIVSRRGNHENRRNQSKYGVGVQKHRNHFRVRVIFRGRTARMGTYDAPEEAQAARREFLDPMFRGTITQAVVKSVVVRLEAPIWQ